MRMTRRRRTTEVAQWALADVDLKPFIYVYELPPEYNVAFKLLPAGWHSEQYDCALPRMLSSKFAGMSVLLGIAAMCNAQRMHD